MPSNRANILAVETSTALIDGFAPDTVDVQTGVDSGRKRTDMAQCPIPI